MLTACAATAGAASAQVIIEPVPGPKHEKAENGQVDPKQDEPTSGDPVTLRTGAFGIHKLDLSIAGRHVDFGLIRTYRNDTVVTSALGPGWDFNWNRKIAIQLKRVYVPVYQGPADTLGVPLDRQEIPIEPGGNPSPPPPSAQYIEAMVPEGAYYYDGATRIERFAAASSGWTTPDGYYSKLLSHGGGVVWLPGHSPVYQQPEWFEMRNAEGTIFTFGLAEAGSGHPGNEYRLTKLQDRRGDTFLLDYEQIPGGGTPHYRVKAVYDTLGRKIAFEYDSLGRLQFVRDPTLREVAYSYDSNGNLFEARSPIVTTAHNAFRGGKRTRYLYSPPATPGGTRDLLQVIAPNEVEGAGSGSATPYLTNTYDANRQVVSQFYGGSKTIDGSVVLAGGKYLFRYAEGPVNHVWFQEEARTLSIDPNGVVELRVFGPNGAERVTFRFTGRLDPASLPDWATIDDLVQVVLGPTKADVNGHLRADTFPSAYSPPHRPTVDPLAFVTFRDFNVHGSVVLEEGPGYRTVSTFDDQGDDVYQRGNLQRRQLFPVPDDGSPPLTTVYVYEPVYNQLRALVEPCGNDTTFVPPNGGVRTVQRYMTQFFYDYQEDSVSSGAIAALAAQWQISLDQPRVFQALQAWWGTVPIAPLTSTGGAGLGELNDDGTTSQVRGNRIKSASPTPMVYTNPAAPGSAFSHGGVIEQSFTFNAFSQLVSTRDPAGAVTNFSYHSESTPNGVDTTPNPVLMLPPASMTLDSTTGVGGGGYMATRTLPEPVSSPIVTTCVYDALGRKVSETDGRGNTSTVAYNELNQPVSSASARTYVKRLFYDANDNVIRCETSSKAPTFGPDMTPVGEAVEGTSIVETRYDILDHAVAQVRRLDTSTSLVTRMRYDRAGNKVLLLKPESITDPLNVESWILDERGKVWRATAGGILPEFAACPGNRDVPEAPASNPDTSSSRYEYDLYGNPTVITDGGNHVSRRLYDGFARKIRDESPATGNYGTLAYDPQDNVVEVKLFGDKGDGSQGLLSCQRQRHDELGRMYQLDEQLFAVGTSTPTPDGGALSPGDGFVTTRFVFDSRNNITKQIDDNAHVTTSTWDLMGRMTSTTRPGGSTIACFYDKASNLIRVDETEIASDGSASATFSSWRFYDEQNRLVASVDNSGRTLRCAYDSRDQVRFSSDANGPLSGMLPSLDVHGDHAVIGGLPTLPINAHGNSTITTFDACGRRTQVRQYLRAGGSGAGAIDPTQAGDGCITRTFQYDANDRVWRSTDDRGEPTTFEYDTLDRLKKTTYPDGSAETTNYDHDGLPTVFHDANANTFVRSFDSRHRLYAESVLRGPGVQGTTNQTFAHDGIGRLVQTTDNNDPADAFDDVVRTARYDSIGHRLIEDQFCEGVSTSVLRTFDGVGNELGTTYPNGRVLTRNFTADDLTNQTFDSAGELARQHWIGPERLLSWTVRGTTLSSAMGYDSSRRLTSTAHTGAGGTSLATFSYDYDRANRRLYESRGHEAGKGSVWRYDSASRLVDEKRDVTNAIAEANAPGSGGAIGSTVHFTLDGASNLTDIVENGTVFHNVVNDLNQYTTFKNRAQSHDANGNRLTSAGAGCEYDAHNRIIRVTRNGLETARYKYDANGQRTAKLLPDGSGTVFVYSYGELLEERSSVDGNAKRQYVRESCTMLQVRNFGNGGAVDYNVLSDGSGSIVALTDAAGVVQERVKYSAYGRPTFCAPDGTATAQLASAVGNALLFVGAYWDSETSLYYTQHRYYDPGAGRFVTRDPLGAWADDVNLGNAYTYSGADPVNRADPDGQYSKAIHMQSTSNFITSKTGKAKYGDIAGKANIGMDKFSNQTSGKSYLHGMSKVVMKCEDYYWMPAGGAAQEAQNALDKQRTGEKIHTELDRAADDLLSGNMEGAMEHFGHASHTAQDCTSSAHRTGNDPKVINSGEPIPWSMGDWYSHMKKEGKIPNEVAVNNCTAANESLWTMFNEHIGTKLSNEMMSGLQEQGFTDPGGFSGQEIKADFEQVCRDMDAAAKFCEADGCEAQIDAVKSQVREKVVAKLTQKLREKAKTDPDAKRLLEKIQGVGNKGDCDHHGSVSRRKQQQAGGACKSDDSGGPATGSAPST